MTAAKSFGKLCNPAYGILQYVCRILEILCVVSSFTSLFTVELSQKFGKADGRPPQSLDLAFR